MHRIIAYNRALLEQAQGLLDQLDDAVFAQPRDLLFGATIGQHMRHVVEYYQCLLAQRDEGLVCYDRRRRDPLMEREVLRARAAVANCGQGLQQLGNDHPLTLECELPDGLGSVRHASSLLRELTYVADHCVHHLAMVRIVLERELPLVVHAGELGVAAATRNHRAR